MSYKIGAKKLMLASIEPSQKEIEFAEENFNRKYPGEGKWKFIRVIPESIFEKAGENSPYKGPTWEFEMQKK